MLQLIKSPRSEADLIDIWLYVAEDQPLNADRLLDQFNHTLHQLLDMPTMGIERPELAPELKSFPVSNYILYYRVSGNQLQLVRVLSSARDIDRVEW